MFTPPPPPEHLSRTQLAAKPTAANGIGVHGQRLSTSTTRSSMSIASTNIVVASPSSPLHRTKTSESSGQPRPNPTSPQTPLANRLFAVSGSPTGAASGSPATAKAGRMRKEKNLKAHAASSVQQRRAGKMEEAIPIVGSPPPSWKMEERKNKTAFSEVGKERSSTGLLPSNFAENPRRAPRPPGKGTRPPSTFFNASEKLPGPLPPPRSPIPPVPGEKGTQLNPAGVSVDGNEAHELQRLDRRPKGGKRSGSSNLPVRTTAPASRASARLSGVQGAKIDKGISNTRKASTATTIQVALGEGDGQQLRRATDGHVLPAASDEAPQGGPGGAEGETLTMLLDSGFFPARESKRSKQSGISITVPPPRSAVIDKALPDTPTSMVATPAEMYHRKSPLATGALSRKAGKGQKRSALSQITARNGKANASILDGEGIPPHRLSAIPENASMRSENTPPASGTVMPLATQIHLRGGSVITLAPPELTAWQRTYFIQSPIIKLPAPTIVPRRDTVASLEPFQEVIDQLYQEALIIPRRRSDDAVVDDICEFVDEFGFDEVFYDGDSLTAWCEDDDDGKAMVGFTGQNFERYSAPPAEPVITPIERAVAQEVVQAMSQSVVPLPKPQLPPVENEETLRAKGIARRWPSTAWMASSSPGRKDSSTLPIGVAGVPIPRVSISESSPLDTVPERSSQRGDAVVEVPDSPLGDQVVGWDEDVAELDTKSSWLAPAAFLMAKRHLSRLGAMSPEQKV